MGYLLATSGQPHYFEIKKEPYIYGSSPIGDTVIKMICVSISGSFNFFDFHSDTFFSVTFVTLVLFTVFPTVCFITEVPFTSHISCYFVTKDICSKGISSSDSTRTKSSSAQSISRYTIPLFVFLV